MNAGSGSNQSNHMYKLGPIHQGIIAPEARGFYYGRLTEMTDTDFRVLPEENSVRFPG